MKGDLFLLLLFYDMRTASCNGDLLKRPDYYHLNPTSEGLVYTTTTTGKRVYIPASSRAAIGG